MTITAPTTTLEKPDIEIVDAPELKKPSPTLIIGGLVAPVVLVVAGFWSVRNVDATKSGDLGLIQQMPPLFYGIVALLALSFVLQLRSGRTRNLVLISHVVALIALFHGTISWIEQSPRFPVTYVHVGFTEFIQRTNHTLPSLDARMSWPGFFAVAAMLDKVAGINTAYQLTLWAPLLFNLTYAPLVFSLARTMTEDKRVPWIATWLFFSVSWVGQDYFSPQGVNFIFFLAFMNILLHYFRTDRAAFPKGMRSISARIASLVQWVMRTPRLRPGGAPIMPTASGQRALLVAALLVIYSASVVSHQLTPFFILLELIILVGLRRIALRGFPLLLIVIVFGYISYGAVGFWSGHFSDIFGGVGQVSSVASQNVGSKVQGHSNHVYVIYGRLALSAALWGAGILGVLRRLHNGRTDIFAMVGFLAPFLVLGGQSYGGEAILRVFLFSLPFAVVLAAFSLLPVEKLRLNLWRSAILFLVFALLGPIFTLARFGNEQFEYLSKNEYVAAQKLFQIAPPGSQLVGIDGNIAWGIEGAGQYTFSIAGNLEPFTDPNRVYQSVAAHGTRSTFLFISRSQLQNIASTDARPANWGAGFEQSLEASGRFRLVYQNPDAAIFALSPPPKAAA